MRRFVPGVAAVAALVAAMQPAGAQKPKAFAGGDPKAGGVLVQRDCVACHAQRFRDATTMYTRADRKVRSPEQLLAQVRVCNVELKAGYFPDEEEGVAAYLNQHYYRFAP